jgi:1-acyl-sn-glycerol-3-phosphate acyltransferase
MFYWLLRHWVVGPYMTRVFRPWVVGLENLPASGGAIIAGNHLSVIDSFLMPLVLDRRVYFLAKSDYFTGKGLKGRLIRWFFLGVGQLPMDRSGGEKSSQSLDAALQKLQEGQFIGIYPEGTRSPDGKMYRGRTGVARMVLDARVPVIPCVMVDTEKIMPIGKRLPRVGRIGIIFGEPIDFSRYYNLEGDRFVLRSITDEIMVTLNRISDQEYVDVYASSVKSRVEAERKALAAERAGR